MKFSLSRKMLTRWGIVVTTGVLLTGCAGFSEKPTRILLKHPDTMEFVSCEVGEWTTQEAFDKNEQCVADYKKQGYVIWAER